MRLTARQWLATLAILLAVIVATPAIWEQVERFDTGPDYRIPYDLSRDYWLYERWIKKVAVPGNVIVLGDSVVWGEYVRPDGTLPSFLNRETDSRRLSSSMAASTACFRWPSKAWSATTRKCRARQKVLLHCNLLWLTSPEADLSSTKEEHFNHSRLVPQFSPRIPCYRADANERLSA